MTPRIRERARELEIEEESCLLWIRHDSEYQPERDLPQAAFKQILDVLDERRIRPILIGAEAPYAAETKRNLIQFYKDEYFSGNPRTQLSLLDHICEEYPIKFSIGAKSGAMDGLAFTRELKTVYFTHPGRNGRMDKVGRVFPAFTKIETNYRRKFLSLRSHELEDIYEAMA